MYMDCLTTATFLACIFIVASTPAVYVSPFSPGCSSTARPQENWCALSTSVSNVFPRPILFGSDYNAAQGVIRVHCCVPAHITMQASPEPRSVTALNASCECSGLTFEWDTQDTSVVVVFDANVSAGSSITIKTLWLVSLVESSTGVSVSVVTSSSHMPVTPVLSVDPDVPCVDVTARSSYMLGIIDPISYTVRVDLAMVQTAVHAKSLYLLEISPSQRIGNWIVPDPYELGYAMISACPMPLLIAADMPSLNISMLAVVVYEQGAELVRIALPLTHIYDDSYCPGAALTISYIVLSSSAFLCTCYATYIMCCACVKRSSVHGGRDDTFIGVPLQQMPAEEEEDEEENLPGK